MKEVGDGEEGLRVLFKKSSNGDGSSTGGVEVSQRKEG